MASEAQNAANRRNAQRSTGPKTTLGKSRSAMNAFQHGIYGEGAMAIPRGPFAEDPRVLEEAIEELAASLQPRDSIEWQQARRIAGTYNQLRRLDEFTAHTLASNTIDHSHLDDLELKVMATGRLAAVADKLYMALADEQDPDATADETTVWSNFGRFVVQEARPEGKSRWVQDLWSADREPHGQAEWRRATLALLITTSATSKRRPNGLGTIPANSSPCA